MRLGFLRQSRMGRRGRCSRDRHLRSSGNEAKTAYNPFVSWDFLEALERSGTVSAKTGWAPRHAVLKRRPGVTAVMPCYAKSHSQGEYVFDWGWADAFERAGGRYYPKLQVSVPFTPVTGPRLLTAPGPHAAGAQEDARGRPGRAHAPHGRLLRARHLPSRGRTPRASPSSASSAAPTSSSTSPTRATATSRAFLPRSLRASARPSGRSGARRSPAASRSNG